MSAPLYDHASEGAVFDALSATAALDVPRARVLAEQAGLVASDFHHPAHVELWDVALGLLRQGQPVDLLLVETATHNSPAVKAAGGRKFLAPLLMGHRDASLLPGLAKTIRDLALRRRMVLAARKLNEAAGNLSVDAGVALSEGSGALAALTRNSTSIRTLQEISDELFKHLDDVQSGKVEPVLPSGVRALDEVIGGLQRTLTVIGAQPGVGKSALLCRIAANLAERGVKVGIFSLEDPGDWLAWRLLSHESGVGQFVLRNRPLNQAQHEMVGDAFKRLWQPFGNVLVDDRSALSPQEIVQTARDMVLNHGVQVVLVDHLGELRYSGPRKERFDLDVAEGLSDLRAISKSYGVPVVCAVHLNRKSEEQGEPRLTSFANSAAIERQARVALGLTRDNRGRLLVHVLKQTNGKAGVKVALEFSGPAALVKNHGGEVIEPEEAA